MITIVGLVQVTKLWCDLNFIKFTPYPNIYLTIYIIKEANIYLYNLIMQKTEISLSQIT